VGSGGMKVGFEEDERSVTSTYFVPGMPPTPQLKPLYPLPAGDFRIFMRWAPSSTLAMQLSMTPPGQPDGSGVVLPMIAACQQQMGTTDLFSLKPVLLQTDVATVKARRRVDSLLQQEVRS
jgi:hypothetical protein